MGKNEKYFKVKYKYFISLIILVPIVILSILISIFYYKPLRIYLYSNLRDYSSLLRRLDKPEFNFKLLKKGEKGLIVNDNIITAPIISSNSYYTYALISKNNRSISLFDLYGLQRMLSLKDFNNYLSGNNIHEFKNVSKYFPKMREYSKIYVSYLGIPYEIEKYKAMSSNLDYVVGKKVIREKYTEYLLYYRSQFGYVLSVIITVPIKKNINSDKVMICLHQSTYSNILEPMGYIYSDNNYAEFFADKNYITISPEMLGFQPKYSSIYKGWNIPFKLILKWNPELTGIAIALLDLRKVIDLLYIQKIFTFNKDEVAIGGLSQGALIAGFMAALDERLKILFSVGGGYHIDPIKKQSWLQPIYFGELGRKNIEDGKFSFDYYQALYLIFPRRIILFNANPDSKGFIPDDQQKILKDIYKSANIEHRLKILMKYPIKTKGSPHIFNKEIQEIILRSINETAYSK